MLGSSLMRFKTPPLVSRPCHNFRSQALGWVGEVWTKSDEKSVGKAGKHPMVPPVDNRVQWVVPHIPIFSTFFLTGHLLLLELGLYLFIAFYRGHQRIWNIYFFRTISAPVWIGSLLLPCSVSLPTREWNMNLPQLAVRWPLLP